MHIPDAKRTKLEDKSFVCVLLGVSEESKAYKLYDPVSKKIVGVKILLETNALRNKE